MKGMPRKGDVEVGVCGRRGCRGRVRWKKVMLRKMDVEEGDIEKRSRMTRKEAG